MREITSHKVNGLNEALKIFVLDEPGRGGACHEYLVTDNIDTDPAVDCPIKFQNGAIGESGLNGVSNESLLAVVADRLSGFQSGPFACHANRVALEHVTYAMDALHMRTRERMQRGVEGTHKV